MTRRQRSPWRPLLFAHLLGHSAVASALSLANFQIITSNIVPSTCIKAYSATIPGCTANDFIVGNECSLSCVRGLERVEAFVESSCPGVEVNPKSLLGLTLSGDLIGSLCPGNQATTTVTRTIQPSTTTRSVTTSEDTTTSLLSTKSTAPESLPTTTTTLTEGRETTSDSQTSLPQPTTTKTEPTTMAPPSSIPATSSVTTTAQNTQPSETNSESTQPSATVDTGTPDDGLPNFGQNDGSPFNVIPVLSSARKLRQPAYSIIGFIGATVATALL